MCPPLTSIDDPNVIIVGSALVGQQVTFSCKEGYALISEDSTVRCTFNGTTAAWLQFDPPSCEGNEGRILKFIY